MFSYTYECYLGKISIRADENFIIALDFGETKNGEIIETALIKKAYQQLEEYFSGKRKTFDLPLKQEGTDFQKKVWAALLTVPYGETCSYKHIAEIVGNAKASRAVGMANNKNNLPIFIPCHRVIGMNGKLVGFGGGLPIKEMLLKLEGVIS